MKKTINILLFLLGVNLFASEEYLKGKIIKELENIEPQEYEEDILYHKNFLVEIKNGEKIEEIAILNPIYKENIQNLHLKKGDRVILYKDYENSIYYFVDKIKTREIIYLLSIFISLFILLAKFRGLKAIISLFSTILFFIFLIVPMITEGFSPILAAVLLGVFSTILTFYSIGGFNKKIIAALAGTLGGIIVAAILSSIFVRLTSLTGYVDADAMNYSSLFEGIDLRKLISAGIIIGSLGAIMDNSVSISSALFEVVSHSENISRKKIFFSGINIGKDVMGTMVNTLVLAYLGSSLFTIMLFYKQQAEFPLIRILNSEFIVVEILRALCGSIGILVTVPITSIASAFLLTRKDVITVEDIDENKL